MFINSVQKERNRGGEILAPESFILETRHIKYEKENKARMKEISKLYGRSIAAQE